MNKQEYNEIENLLGWEHTLQINNQLIKHNIATILISIPHQFGRHFFSTEDYTNTSYYNCCGIRPKHSNISKMVGEGVFTICVVLDESTVICEKAGGSTICGVLRSK
jgi:hypothetical protein